MFCSNCGKLIPDGEVTCPNCGVTVIGIAQTQVSEDAQIVSGDGVSSSAVTDEPQLLETMAGQNVQMAQPMQIDTIQKNGEDYQSQQNTDSNYEYQYQQTNFQGNTYYENNNMGTMGTSNQQNWNSGQPGQQGSSGESGALVCGIISICLSCITLVGAIAGVVLGIVGLVLAINYRKKNGGGATGGFVTSIVGLSLSAITFLSCIACFGGVASLGCNSCGAYSNKNYSSCAGCGKSSSSKWENDLEDALKEYSFDEKEFQKQWEDAFKDFDWD